MGYPMVNLLPALLCLARGLVNVQSFNIETDRTVSFSQDQTSGFGHSVTQFQAASEKWTVVSAPLKEDANGNRTGALYRCSYVTKRCDQINIQSKPESGNFGLTLTTGDSNGQKLLACNPRLSFQCYTNSYITGYCYVLDASFLSPRKVPEKTPECPKALIDIAFLIDGSGSVQHYDFEKMKNFIKAIMRKFKNKETQIAVVQFSSRARTEFDFNSYRSVDDKEVLVTRIRQLNSATETPTGIKFVADNIFVPSAGAQAGAKRILITITDGQSQDRNFQPAIDAANRKKIERYAIGVGGAFTNYWAKIELQTIASKSQNVFQVENFAALDNIQKELQEKIFAIEGTHGSGVISAFQLEMAQEGFSTIITSDAVVVGAVGAYDWSGGLAEFRAGGKTFVNLTASHTDMKNAYLGYAVKEAKQQTEAFYVVGAPRYQHKGEVLVFPQRNPKDLREKIVGVQIGSYFGSELCSVDLNKDGRTDLVLVGAPMYQDQGIGGIVHVYKMTKTGQLRAVKPLFGEQGNLLARFGSAIAAVSDLNGDGISDVAIGAPLEDGHQGSVYIFHGASGSINPKYSQQIRSLDIEQGLRYFGQSIHGSMDVSGDGLPDLTVGALGKAFVFRSRPVLDIRIAMSFVPGKVLLKHVDCLDPSMEKIKVEAEICFTIMKLTTDTLGSPTVNLTYELNVDPGRTLQRAELKSEAVSSFLLRDRQCLKPVLQVEDCIQDFHNPILLQVNFSVQGQVSGDNPPPILRQGNSGVQTGKLPFEKDCGEDNICTDHLRVGFTFAGAQFLVVGSHSTLTLDVTLENLKEDSQSTLVIFVVPVGLSFRKAAVIQKSSKRAHIECKGQENAVDVFLCKINHPIFRKQTKIIFNITFDIAADADWAQTARISVNATSDNEHRIKKDSFVSKDIVVKYEINVIINGIESTQYINFTTEKADTKLVNHTYKVENVGQRSLPVEITFTIPTKIGPGLSWEELEVNSTVPGKALCLVKVPVVTNETNQGLDANNSQVCNVTQCYVVTCQITQLKRRQRVTLSIVGAVHWSNSDQAAAAEVMLTSFAQVGYDEQRYIHVSQATNQFQKAKVNTRVEIVQEFNPLPIIVGSTIGGLVLLAILAGILYKAGFFKRGYKDMLQEEEGDESAAAGSPAEAPAAEGMGE